MTRFKITVNKPDGGQSVSSNIDAITCIETATDRLKKLVSGEISNFTAEVMEEAG